MTDKLPIKKTAAQKIARAAAADTPYRVRGIIDVILVLGGVVMLVLHEDHDHSNVTAWILIASGTADAGVKLVGSAWQKRLRD